MKDENGPVQINVQIPFKVREDFRIAARLKGTSMSSVIHQNIVRTIHEEKEKDPKKFPAADDAGRDLPSMEAVSEPTAEAARRYYAERFDAEGLSATEWQFLETYFAGYVDAFKKGKADGRAASVVAHIGPGKKPDSEPTREDAQRMIDAADIGEIEKRVTPRKRKAG